MTTKVVIKCSDMPESNSSFLNTNLQYRNSIRSDITRYTSVFQISTKRS